MKNIDARKYQLIQEILKLNDEYTISRIENELHNIKDNEDFWKAVQPIKKDITLEQMIKEQNYKPLERTAFFEEVDALNIEEPIEELLAMLNK